VNYLIFKLRNNEIVGISAAPESATCATLIDCYFAVVIAVNDLQVIESQGAHCQQDSNEDFIRTDAGLQISVCDLQTLRANENLLKNSCLLSINQPDEPLLDKGLLLTVV